MNNEATAATLRRSACHICQGQTFTWGRINTPGVTQFLPHDQSMMDWFLSRGAKLNARLCSSCGNVQLFNVEEDER